MLLFRNHNVDGYDYGGSLWGLEVADDVPLLVSGNEQTLRLVDSATFVLSLEELNSEDPNTLSRLFLYGDPANRLPYMCYHVSMFCYRWR